MFDWQGPMELRPTLKLPSEEESQDSSPQETKQYGVQFKASIKAFVKQAESEIKQTYNITQLCNDFDFQRRRLYDVISILEALGCCEKVTVDRVTWYGLSAVPSHLRELQKTLGVNKPDTEMGDIFLEEQMILLAHLTVSFVLCFLVLRQPVLDIKNIAMFLSRHNGRFKSTLCKLYQITYILDAAGIIMKTAIPSQIVLAPEYYTIVPMVGVGDPDDVLSIMSLLNRHDGCLASELEQMALARRRQIFSQYFVPHFYKPRRTKKPS